MIIDIQEKLINAAYNNSTLKNKAQIIARAANILELPVIVTELLGYRALSVKP